MRRALMALLLAGGTAMTARTDEGMWLLNDPPSDLLKEKYNFDLTDEFVDRAMAGSVRFNSGGSGGFVSPDGLIVTNHHIAADALEKLSTARNDLYQNGFHARTRADERKCPDLELNVLQSIEDVTDRVDEAVKPGLSSADASTARRAVMSNIEKESLAKTGLRSDVVTLYNGGAYHLYRYKKYTDVRLVFAPELKIAAFGGDVDNFEYPRYSLDVSFFRAYDNDKPAKVEHYFEWSTVGPMPDDLVFVTGHPGSTQRLETLAKLIHRRDVTLPYTLYRLRTLEAALSQYGEESPEQHRRAGTDHHRVANARKAYSGQLLGLLDQSVIDRKSIDEKKLIHDIGVQLSSPGLDKDGKPYLPMPVPGWWNDIAKAEKTFATFEREYSLLERGDAFYSELFTIARQITRLADETRKPSADRLREYRDSNLESLKFQLYSPAPIYADLERRKLQTSLTFLAEVLGGDHPMVVKILAGKNPADRATELIAGTKLADPAERKRLVEGGAKAIAKSDDGMLRLALAVDAEARRLRKRYEDEVEEPERQAYAAIDEARFNALGKSVAPDATFTLRLAFGTVSGYDVDGQTLPFQTTFAGLFRRAEEMDYHAPFNLPERWKAGKAKLDLSAPVDFVSTADTIGGNSGSPVLNRAGELVGINFDRNRHGLVRNFVYTDVQARHISVHGLGVLEALRKIYDADELLAELVGGN